MRQAQWEVWDAGAAEASYGFAGAEEKKKKRKKTECIALILRIISRYIRDAPSAFAI
jgi:hypothetical protein